MGKENMPIRIISVFSLLIYFPVSYEHMFYNVWSCVYLFLLCGPQKRVNCERDVIKTTAQ